MTDVTQIEPDQNDRRVKIADILDRIKNRGCDDSVGHSPPNETVAVDPMVFYLRTVTEGGQEAMIYLLTNPNDIEVTIRPQSSIYKIRFNDPAQAAYFKLKYAK